MDLSWSNDVIPLNKDEENATVDKSGKNDEEVNSLDFLNCEEKAQIFAWSQRSVGKVIFDYSATRLHGCSGRYFNAINSVKGFLIAILCGEYLFGVVVTKPVQIYGDCVADSNCFVFVLRENGIKKRRKFSIKEEDKEFAFTMGRHNSTKFFEVGKGDLKLYRKKTKNCLACEYNGKSFEYGEKRVNVLGSENRYGQIKVDRFVIFALEN
ncbi:hypothetical protein EIN_507480 [Entamoeba invadens IP1]|uniref:TLDc domain-containing protein n=1 Tax=Entamoeba invadens IP1 TaxID=370355 RepID=A0A0A1UC81_ENTIV|nr:hypothetical protein EIN_507480 [Entamoeba invadens IP1]ELP92847.1 hypothetical protein EIN_507480 [Entamoeba invadens IP1]|eukprot:XP_004259618.1 hypothetical protein EIN_507480 [Entamoeba invadens IP1]